MPKAILYLLKGDHRELETPEGHETEPAGVEPISRCRARLFQGPPGECLGLGSSS